LGKVLEAARWQGMIHGFIYYPETRVENAFFVASQSIKFSKKFNDINYKSHYGENRPLRAKVYVSNVGKTSFTIALDLFDDKSGVKLAQNLLVGVNVSRNKRKPAPIPKYFYNNLDQYLKNVENRTIERSVLPTIPSKAFRYEIKCAHSDCDMNKHITQAAYLKYCSDAASVGSLTGHFDQFRRHIELYPLKSTVFHYIGEALVNDTIAVNVWEKEGCFRTLDFVITRKEKIIFIMNMEFYDGKPAVVSPHLVSKL
jgi:acyl-CoA thioesterase FadM